MEKHSEDSPDDVFVTIPLTMPQALVLYEWLSSLNDRSIQYEHPADREMSSYVLAALEEKLPMLFSPDYRKQHAEAREIVAPKEDYCGDLSDAELARGRGRKET